MKKKTLALACVLALCFALALPVYATTPTPDVAGVIQNTWTAAATQIKSVVNTVVFPALDMILAIAFFVKLGTCYFDYRKHGQMEWTPPVILFACLVFTLTAPQYIWNILGI